MLVAGPLPQTGDQQEIGADAAKCFTARIPGNWLHHSLDGTDDFGFDYQIQTTPGQQVTDVFRVQLKGTRSPDWSADKEFLSIQLKASTVRYYERVVEPILLVVCDLSVDPDPVDCRLYYVWLRDELRRISVSGLDPKQKYVSLRVPGANRLTRSTDLGPQIHAQNQMARAGHLLGLGMGQAFPDHSVEERVELALGIAAQVVHRSPTFVNALAHPPDQHWIDPAQGSMSARLRSAESYMKVNSLDRAAIELDRAFAMFPQATTLETAEYWFWRGKWHVAHCRDPQAVECFENALQTKAFDKYVAALAEAHLRIRHKGVGVETFADLHELVKGSGPLLLSIQSKLFAAEANLVQAIAVADELSGADRWSARALAHFMREQPAESLKDCEMGLADPDISDACRQTLHILRARSKFFIAKSTALARAGEILLPSGIAGIDATLVKEAWMAINDAVAVLRETGWGRNVELVADIWGATASMLGKQADILRELAEIGKLRPNYFNVQSALESVAAQCGDFDQAMKANERLPESQLRDLRRTIGLHEAGKDTACVGWFESRFSELDPGHVLFGPATGAAALSAHRLAKPSLFEQWSGALNAEPRFAEHVALLEFYVAIDKNSIGKKLAMEHLVDHFERLGRPFTIAVTLLQELEPTIEAQALRCIELSERVGQEIEPSPAMARHVGVAFVTLKRWDDLLRWCQQFRTRVDAVPRMLAFEALALDQLGRTTEAKAALESMLDKGVADSLALDTYVAIAVRCGYVNEALAVAERIMEAAATRREKIECVRLRFNLIQQSDPSSERLLALALQLGRLSDASIEHEEAAYLCMFLTATMGESSPVQTGDVEEFRRRAEAFFSAFPTSRLLKRGEIRQEQSGEELLAQLKDIVGIRPEAEAFRRRLERNMKDGLVMVPFSWRPRQVLANVHDCVQLWELAKSSRREERQFHLPMVKEGNWALIPGVELRSRMPLLDITALLVLRDLGLFETVVDFFGQVALAKATMEELAQLVHVFSGSPARNSCLALQDMLKTKLGQIVQPSITFGSGGKPVQREGDDFDGYGRENTEIASLCRKDSRFRLYSDDVALRVMVGKSDNPDGMCTLDVLAALTHAGVLTDAQAAEKLALLCQWNVGLTVRLRDMLAAIPSEFSGVSSSQEGISFLDRQPNFVAIANAVWDIGIHFDAALGHAASVLRELATEGRMSRVGISALLGQWFVKMLLRPDCRSDPLDLLAKLIVKAAAPQGLDPSAAGTLWWVCSELAAYQARKELDGALLLETLNAVAAECAALDSLHPRLGEITHASVRLGLVDGTMAVAQFDKFFRAYSGCSRPSPSG